MEIFSPNHIELLSLFSVDINIDSSSSFQEFKSTIEDLATRCLNSGIGANNQGTIIVRCGEYGCVVFSRKEKIFRWLPAFYEHETEAGNGNGDRDERVIDVTGTGNAFLGALVVGLERGAGDEVLACCFGAVGASFVVEGVGVGGVAGGGGVLRRVW